MYICRQWTQDRRGDWTSEFDRFETEREAREHGEIFKSLIRDEEQARDYEVLEDGKTN